MLCPGCGTRIEAGETCSVCEAADELRDMARRTKGELCRACGNEIYDGGPCQVCAAARRGPALETCPKCGSEVEDPAACPVCAEPDSERLRFCAGCGNEVPAPGPCPICTDMEARRNRDPDARLTRSQLCPGCGNEIYGDGPCGICSLGRARKRDAAPKKRVTLCPGCGHEVDDPRHCPICRQGKSLKKAKHLNAICPKCDDALDPQDWDGAEVHVCGTCNGALFVGRALEETLDKLRASMEGQSLPKVLAEFRDRHKRGGLPDKVRYKSCPVCGLSMVRRNYAGVSGVIVDVCGRHGTWVDHHEFGDLTDFVSRGGDELARLRQKSRRR